jgi:hypothetical protein
MHDRKSFIAATCVSVSSLPHKKCAGARICEMSPSVTCSTVAWSDLMYDALCSAVMLSTSCCRCSGFACHAPAHRQSDKVRALYTEMIEHAQRVADEVIAGELGVVVVAFAIPTCFPRRTGEVRREGGQVRAPVAAVAADAVHGEREGPVAGQRAGDAGCARNMVERLLRHGGQRLADTGELQQSSTTAGQGP